MTDTQNAPSGEIMAFIDHICKLLGTAELNQEELEPETRKIIAAAEFWLSAYRQDK